MATVCQALVLTRLSIWVTLELGEWPSERLVLGHGWWTVSSLYTCVENYLYAATQSG